MGLRGAAKKTAGSPHFLPSGSRAPAGLLRCGDRLQVNCVMNTLDGTPFSRPLSARQGAMVTGMDKGMGMCGTLVMYYPHAPTVRYANGGFITHKPGEAKGSHM